MAALDVEAHVNNDPKKSPEDINPFIIDPEYMKNLAEDTPTRLILCASDREGVSEMVLTNTHHGIIR